jgi:streptogramin lyase
MNHTKTNTPKPMNTSKNSQAQPLARVRTHFVTSILMAVSLFVFVFKSGADDLFVASFLTGNITRIDGDTGAIVYSVPQGGSTINVAKGADGQLYVTTLFASTVIKTDWATGAPLGTFASGGGLATSVGITFGPDGQLYVASRDTDEVLRFDGATGTFLGTFVTSASGGLDAPEELLFGPDGNLYVTEFSGNRVLRYNGATGAFIDVFASDGSLSGARGIAFGPDGNLYVSGNFSDNVVQFNGGSGAFIQVFATGIAGANGIAFGPDGNLYVASESGNAILRLNGTTGALIDTFATVTGPVGIFFDITPTPAFNARELKEEAIDALTALLPEARVSAAISQIQSSLNSSFWADDSHLTSQGARVFEAERKAVNELVKVKQPNAIIQAAIATLVEVDAALAQIAIDDATAAGGDPDQLDSAARQFARASAITGANAAERAIQAYREAWVAAQNSLAAQ